MGRASPAVNDETPVVFGIEVTPYERQCIQSGECLPSDINRYNGDA